MMNRKIIVATEERWRQQAEAALQEAENLPFGRQRETSQRSTAVANRFPNRSMAIVG